MARLSMLDGQLGFIGAGQMARALARGFVAKGLIKPEQILACDPEPAAREQFQREMPGCRLVASNQEVVRHSQVVLLAVKPQSFPAVAAELAGESTEGRLFLSILAGVSLSALRNGLRSQRVVRIMPNTPALIGRGAAAYAVDPEPNSAGNATESAAGRTVEPSDVELVEALFRSVGTIVAVPERLLDAVTGLSGSGPAYVYVLIEALSDGGVRMGLPRSVALNLAAQTVLGAAEMVLATGEHPGELKDRVTSPAGTTIAGLQVLERRGVRSAMIDAVEAATLRSRELGTPSSSPPANAAAAQHHLKPN